MTGPHVMDAIRETIRGSGHDASDENVGKIRRVLSAVLRRLPRDLTVGDLLAELEES